MGRRSLVAVLLIPLVCLALGLILFLSNDQHSLTLADLAPRDSQAPGFGLDFLWSSQTVGQVSAADWILILYLLVGSLVALVALRFIVSAVRVAKADRLANTADDASVPDSAMVRSASPDPVGSPRVLRLVVPSDAAVEFDSPPEGPTVTPSRPKEHFFAEVRAHFRSYAHGLTGKIILTFMAITAAFGLLTGALVYWTLSASLWGHALDRARITATNAADSAPAYLLARNATGPRESLRRLSSKPGIAYLLIVDRGGKIFADSFPVMPEEMEKLTLIAPSPGENRSFRLGNGIVREVSVPILEGRLGAVRVGVWQDEVDAAIRETLIPLMLQIALVTMVGVIAALLLAWKINRPIIRLVRAAREISHGELDSPGPNVADPGEYGEISRALERMRSSVRAAMIRLNGEYY